MRKIVPLITAAIMVLSLASSVSAGELKATGGYSALADGDGNGTSFITGGLRYDADRFLVGGSYAMDLDYNPTPPLKNSDDLFLVYGGPRLLEAGPVKLTAVGGYYQWGSEVTDNLLTGATLRTELHAAALGVQASAALGPFGAELLYLKGLSNGLEQIVVNNDVDTSWLELRGTVRLNEDVRAYLAYHDLGYAAGETGDELRGYGVGLTSVF
ncbi:MAG: hypothetical protein ACM3ZC_16495 [Bacteroidota bacterium]